jgi:hypothetical protein
MCVSRPHSASLSRHDAPRIGERAATHGRRAMEGGDERAGVKSAAAFAAAHQKRRRNAPVSLSER